MCFEGKNFCVQQTLENPIDQKWLVSFWSVITNKMGDVILEERAFGFELKEKERKEIYILPSHLAVLCIILSCCRDVIYEKVTGEVNSAWKAATAT